MTKRTLWLYVAVMVLVGSSAKASDAVKTPTDRVGPESLGEILSEQTYPDNPPGSGCDPTMYGMACARAESILVCGVGLVREKALVPGVTFGTYKVSGKEIKTCEVSAKDGMCSQKVEEQEWFIMEFRFACGNGHLVWRNLARLSPDKMELAPYDAENMEALGLATDASMLALVESNMFADSEAPYTPAEKK